MKFRTRAELQTFCRQDRDYLLGEYCQRHDLADAPVPAEALDGILEDVLSIRIIPRHMPDSHLGYCIFDRRVVSYNLRLAEVALPRTNVDGLRHSTLAHELAHLRLGHEQALRTMPDRHTLPLFGDLATPRVIECRRDWKRRGELSVEERRLEREANMYASIFLVPERPLVSTPAGAAVRGWWETNSEVNSDELWRAVYDLVAAFQVTPDLMSWRLVDLGWIERRSKKLSIASQQALPFVEA